MSGRGGRGGPARSIPNLSLAGKREDHVSQNGSARGGRGRGGRGRGRGGQGRGGNKQKQELIQTMGVFSEGLHSEDRKKERIRLQLEVPQKRVKEEATTIADMANAQASSARGYAELWESDESGDEEELREMLRDNFLNDAKCGRVLPIVTPAAEEEQFKRLMHSAVKKEIVGSDDDEDVKPTIPTRTIEEDTDPTLTHSREAARLIGRIMEDGSSDLLLVQIPSVVPILAREMAKNEGADGHEEEVPIPCSSGLPRGHRVGALRASADGGIEMRLGGQRLALTKNIGSGSGYYEALTMVEVPPSALLNSPSASGVFGGRPQVPGDRPTVVHLGDIHHHLVAALDWTETIEKGRKMKEKEAKAAAANEYVSSPSKKTTPALSTADRATLETRMDALSKARAERAQFLTKWGTEL